MPPPSDPWLPYRKPRSQPARIRLFCFPYAGGGASMYRGFSELFPQTIEVCAVQLPGREGRLREAPIADISALVPKIADGLQKPLAEGPFAFFGHSMGSILGFELSRELRRRNHPAPAHLFASACPAPHIPDDDETHTLGDDALIDKLRELGGMSEEVLAHRELMEMILPLFRADAAVTETYVHAEEEPLATPITAFGGLADDKATRADMDAWRKHTRGAFALAMVPGGHFYVQDAAARGPVLAAVARTLTALG
jgi:medium-chain acyl-[acyl-carrier-protein] hydrolase